MIERALSGDMRAWVLKALRKSPIFAGLRQQDEGAILSHGKLIEYQANEVIIREGTESDFFMVILNGEARMMMSRGSVENLIDIGTVRPFESVGEIGLLLNEPRMATIQCASESVLTLQFRSASFELMLGKIRGFAAQTARVLAKRLSAVSHRLPIPLADEASYGLLPEPVIGLLPLQLVTRQQILPLRFEGGLLTLGFVHDPKPEHMTMVRQHHPAVDIRVVRITMDFYTKQMKHIGAIDDKSEIELDIHELDVDEVSVPEIEELDINEISTGGPVVSGGSRAHIRVGRKSAEFRHIEPLLERMVAEGASDIHLAAQQVPRWRIDGDLFPIAGSDPLGEGEVYEMLRWLAPKRAIEEFERHNDCDFAYKLPGVSRFRVNMYRDEHGINAAMRQIPDQVPELSTLGLPDGIQRITQLSRGLVLVTGPTGSGKSTTLAAMISQLNKHRRSHIVTLEDPIEFVYESETSLVNQREIGSHADSFTRALRASLRQDPDIVLVGELRDLETVRLALETANTGHLVFGTLHTNTAISTIDRMINLFPTEEQSQARGVLAETLKGVISQMLCKRLGGGRVAAFELLFVTGAIGNLIRQGKTHQIISAMSTGRGQGQCMLNEHLEDLVKGRLIDKREALYRAHDKEDLAQRLS